MDCHRLAVEVRRQVLRMVRTGPARKDYRFSNQIRDSARSAPANIAEGFSRFIPAEMLQFSSYAKASLDETKNHVVDGLESNYFSRDDANRVLRLIARSLGALRGWMRYLESPAARRFYADHRAMQQEDGIAPLSGRRKRGLKVSTEKATQQRPEASEPRTPNQNPNQNPEPEPRTRTPNPRTVEP
jgi:four helix bundle protein